MKKWYKEPLLHFLIIGALIFVLFSVVNKDEDTVSGNKIVVGTGSAERIAALLIPYNYLDKVTFLRII